MPHAYCTVEDLRAEGVTEAQASDAKLLSLVDEVSREIDSYTGWWFVLLTKTLTLSGRGERSLDLPAPLASLTSVSIDGIAQDESDFFAVGPAPVERGFYSAGPAIERIDGTRWPKGRRNIVIEGVFGYTEDDPEDEEGLGITPPAIRRACLMMVIGRLTPLAEDDPGRDAKRVTAMRTRTQSVDLREIRQDEAPLTGDPDVDQILVRYCRPIGLGAA